MIHYFPEDRKAELEVIAEAHGFIGPSFIGQGCTYSVGSDSYGKYITDIRKIGKKTIYGLVDAHSEFETSWTDGTEICTMPKNTTPTKWIIQSGWLKNKKTGEKIGPKFYFCDASGKKFNGQKCTYRWNGAYSYRDPSF